MLERKRLQTHPWVTNSQKVVTTQKVSLGYPESYFYPFLLYSYKLQKYIYKRDNRYKPKGNECNCVTV